MSSADVAVIGAGLPGLAAAVLLARAHRRVVVVDPAGLPGGVLAARGENGQVIAAGPALTCGFGAGGVLRYLYAAAGLAAPVRTPGVPVYQVALPDRRISVFSEGDATREELRREFPREIDRIARLMGELVRINDRCGRSRFYAFLAKRRSAASFLAAHGCSRELSAFFGVQLRSFFGHGTDGVTLRELAEMVAAGPLPVPGGWQVLAGRLRDVLTSLGGEFRTGGAWPDIQILSRRVRSVVLREGEITAGAVLLNTPWQEERSLLLSVKGEGIPVGMASTVLCLAAYAEPREVFVLSCADAERVPGHGNSGAMKMVANFLPAAQRPAPDGRLLDRLRILMPFLDGFLLSSVEREPWPERPVAYDRFLPQTAARSRLDADMAAGVRNLWLLRDRSFALVRPISRARRIAEKLS